MALAEKAKAEELVYIFSPMVPGYMGSSMLTNTEYPEVILHNAKKASKVVVGEILREFLASGRTNEDPRYKYWEKVGEEIDLIKK